MLCSRYIPIEKEGTGEMQLDRLDWCCGLAIRKWVQRLDTIGKWETMVLDYGV